MNRCSAITSAGLRCRKPAGPSPDLCVFHDGRTENRPAANGAQTSHANRAQAVRRTRDSLRSTDDCLKAFEQARRLARRSTEPDAARRAQIIVAAATAALKALGTDALEKEVEELRALVAERLGDGKAA